MDPLKFKYVRIQGKELAKNTMYAKGIFSMCWQLIQQDVMEKEDADLFCEIDSQMLLSASPGFTLSGSNAAPLSITRII